MKFHLSFEATKDQIAELRAMPGVRIVKAGKAKRDVWADGAVMEARAVLEEAGFSGGVMLNLKPR